jgi:hypothetical protein
MQASVDEQWARYGRALINCMSDVLTETPDDSHANLLETADYWLSLGLVLGLRQPAHAQELLQLIEAHEAERGELEQDAGGLISQVFE